MRVKIILLHRDLSGDIAKPLTTNADECKQVQLLLIRNWKWVAWKHEDIVYPHKMVNCG